jgi:hypothetical protein
MKSILVICLAVAGPCGVANAQGYNYGTGSNSSDTYVSPHYRSDGAYVGGHYRTNPNSYGGDNYGASGNYNYHTGRTGRGY